MTQQELIADAVRREVAKAPPLNEHAADLLRRLGCPIVPKQERKSA